MAKRFVLSGYFGFKNFGDEAILSVLVNKLQQDKHHLTIISSDPEYTRKKYKHIRSVYTFDLWDIAGFISKSDCLISGGGSLLQDVTSLNSLFYYLVIIFIALFFRKKVIIFAQGIGPIKNKVGQVLTREILKHCTYVSVRDKKSHDLLTKWGINSDLLCDPVFSTNISQTEKDGSIAVQLRDFKTMTEDFIDRLASKISKTFQGKEIKIYPLQYSIDLDVCKKFEKAIKLLQPDIPVKIMDKLTDEEIVNNIARSEYLIAMRFHAIIVGIISGIKTLGINYDIKVEKLCDEFNLPYIEIDKDFNDEFEKLQKINLDELNEKVKTNNFNWENVDKTIDQL